MTSRGLWVLLLAATACRSDGPPPRERVLARIPADSMAVIAADGAALTQPRIRAVVDVLRPAWPARMGCAIDAALASDHVALGITQARSAVLVLETGTAVSCPALSQIGPRTWVATIGDATVASGASVLDDPRFERARPYLATAPFAMVIDIPGGRAIASASAAPLDAWVALDVHPLFADVIEHRVRAYVGRLADDPGTGLSGAAIRVERTASQIVARLDRPLAQDVDAALAVRTVLGWHRRPATRAPEIACPPITAPVLACSAQRGRVRISIASVVPLIDAILAAPFSPVVSNGMAEGLRLGAAIPLLGLEAGDVVIAIGTDRVTRTTQLATILRGRTYRLQLTFVRDHTPTDLVLVEH